jgi:hypothetical protein
MMSTESTEVVPDLDDVQRALRAMHARCEHLAARRRDLIIAAGVKPRWNDALSLDRESAELLHVGDFPAFITFGQDDEDGARMSVPRDVFEGRRSVEDWAAVEIKRQLTRRQQLREQREASEREQYATLHAKYGKGAE